MFLFEKIPFVMLCHSDKFQLNGNFSFHFMIINVIWRFFTRYKKLQVEKCGINKRQLIRWLLLFRIQYGSQRLGLLL